MVRPPQTHLTRLLGHRPARTVAALPEKSRAALVSGYELQRALQKAGRVAALFRVGEGVAMQVAVRAAAHRDAVPILIAPRVDAAEQGPRALQRADAGWLAAVAEAVERSGLGAPVAAFGTAESDERAYELLEKGYTGIACREHGVDAPAAALRPARESEMGTLYAPPVDEGGPDALSATLVELARAGMLPDWVAVPPGAEWAEAVKPSLPVAALGREPLPQLPLFDAGAYDFTDLLAPVAAEGADEMREALAWDAVCEAMDHVNASRAGHVVGDALMALWKE